MSCQTFLGKIARLNNHSLSVISRRISPLSCCRKPCRQRQPRIEMDLLFVVSLLKLDFVILRVVLLRVVKLRITLDLCKGLTPGPQNLAETQSQLYNICQVLHHWTILPVHNPQAGYLFTTLLVFCTFDTFHCCDLRGKWI